MSSAESKGQFVWHELMTTDIPGAGAFYPRVAGWTTQPWEQDSSYTLWVGNAGPAGGVMSLPDAAPASHWMPYIATPDIAGTVEMAGKLGATVLKDTTEIPNGGKYAVLQDPLGAVFSVYTAGAQSDSAAASGESDFSWHELATSDFDAALRFYMELFGWSRGPTHDMGELGYYQIFAHGGKNIGGIYNMPPGVTTPHWLSYVRVSDVDEAARAAKAAGGRVINGPMEVPGGDWVAQIVDPQGAAFAVHEVRPPARAKAQPAAKLAARPSAKPTAKATRRASVAQPAKKKHAAAKKRVVAKRSGGKKKRVAAKAKVVSKRKRTPQVKRTAARKASAARRRPAARKPRVRKLARRKSARRLRAKRRR